jgi:hypothetical protein
MQIKDYLVITNIEYIDDTQFLVLIVFQNGRQVDKIIRQYKDINNIFETLLDMSIMHGTMTYDLWTTTPEIFKETIGQAGINAHYKHRSDTTVTGAAIRTDEELLREIHGIQPKGAEPEEERPQIPQWRAILIDWLSKLIKLIGGKYLHE